MTSRAKIKHVFKIILSGCKRMGTFKEVFVPYFLEVNSSLKTAKIIRISCKLCLSFESKEKFIAFKNSRIQMQKYSKI